MTDPTHNLVERLRFAAANKALPIGEAWNLLDECADELKKYQADVSDLLPEADAKDWALGEMQMALNRANEAEERCIVVEKINAQLRDDLTASEKWREALRAENERQGLEWSGLQQLREMLHRELSATNDECVRLRRVAEAARFLVRLYDARWTDGPSVAVSHLTNPTAGDGWGDLLCALLALDPPVPAALDAARAEEAKA
jgi:hypothetical protein